MTNELSLNVFVAGFGASAYSFAKVFALQSSEVAAYFWCFVIFVKQECIPVGCVPSVALAIWGCLSGGVSAWGGVCQGGVHPLPVDRILDTCLWKHAFPQLLLVMVTRVSLRLGKNRRQLLRAKNITQIPWHSINGSDLWILLLVFHWVTSALAVAFLP